MVFGVWVGGVFDENGTQVLVNTVPSLRSASWVPEMPTTPSWMGLECGGHISLWYTGVLGCVHNDQ